MTIKSFLKVAFAFTVVFWLIAKGQLDFSLITKSVDNLKFLAFGFCIITILVSLGGYRWKILLEIKSQKTLPIIDVMKVNWIGLFFSSFLPGIVTGDVIKLFYAKELDESLDKTFLMMSIILDRTLGLSGLVLLMGVFSFFNYEALSNLGSNMEAVLRLNMFIFFSIILVLMFLFLPFSLIYPLVTKVKDFPLIGPLIFKIYTHLRDIENDKKSVVSCLLLSIFIQFLHIIAFLVLTYPFYEKPISLSWAFSLIPLGDIAIALPISPSGLGVGHVAFQSLFEFIGINNGANLFNIYFIVMISVNCLGVFPYIFAGKKYFSVKT